jgi:hypothetical protein
MPPAGAHGSGQCTCHAEVVRPQAGHTTARKRSGGANPAIEDQAHRHNIPLGNDRYGPAGRVQVSRAYNDPTSGGKNLRRMPSAFGAQDMFRGGQDDGRS